MRKLIYIFALLFTIPLFAQQQITGNTANQNTNFNGSIVTKKGLQIPSEATNTVSDPGCIRFSSSGALEVYDGTNWVNAVSTPPLQDVGEVGSTLYLGSGNISLNRTASGGYNEMTLTESLAKLTTPNRGIIFDDADDGGKSYIYYNGYKAYFRDLEEHDTIAMLSDIYNLGNKKKFEYPLGWTFIPFNIYKNNGSYFIDRNIKDLVKDKINSLQPYYVDFNNGSNSNNGTTRTTAYKTINYALTQGAKHIILLPGVHQNSAFTGNINNSSYGSDDKFIIAEKPEDTFIVHNTEGAIYTTYNAIYKTDLSATVSGQATRSAVDFKFKDRYGMPYRLQEKTSIAEVEATPGSFYFDATPDILYIRLLDDRAPDSNVFNLTHNSPVTWQGSSSNEYLYIEGVTFIGGNGALTVSTVGDGAFSPNYLINNCRFLYSSGNGLRVRNTGGLLWCNNSIAYDCASDGWNYTQNASLTSQKAIETFCLSFNNGRNPLTTSSLVNASSAHDNITILRVGGKGWDNVGPNYIDVRGNKSLLVGVEAFNSLGYDDGSFTVHWRDWGDFVTGSDTGTPSTMYLYDCKSNDSRISFSTPLYLIDGTTPDDSQMYVNESTWGSTYEGNINFGQWSVGSTEAYTYPSLSSFTYPSSGFNRTQKDYVDTTANAKVENNITASTTVAPSKTAVLSNFTYILKNSATATTVTGTTSETILSYAPMPAGTGFGNLKCVLRGTKTGTAGTISLKFYLSTTTDLTGSLGQIGAMTVGTTQSSPWFERNYILGSDGNIRGVNFAGTVDVDQTSFNTAFSSLACNPSTTSYNIVATAQLANSADSFTMYNYFVEHNREK